MRMTSHWSRAGRAAAFGLLGLAAWSGCSTTTVCPAIGYVYTGPVNIRVPGESPATVRVSACFGDTCRPVDAEVTGRGWSLNVGEHRGPGGATQPASITVVVTSSATGVELGRSVYPIDWKRVGAAGPCPGPVTPQLVTAAAG